MNVFRFMLPPILFWDDPVGFGAKTMRLGASILTNIYGFVKFDNFERGRAV